MRKALMFMIILGLVVGTTSTAVGQTSYAGVVTVDSAKVRPAESVSVKVWLKDNSIGVSAVTLPLRFSSSALTLDSVSLEGTVWGPEFAGYFMIDNVNRTAVITVLPDEAVYPLPGVSFVDGVIAELFFSVADGVSPHLVAIDSVYTELAIGGGVHVFTRLDVSDNTGSGVFLPEFVPGEIEILVPTGVEDDPGSSTLPAAYELAQNYPNPFNPSTIVGFSLPRAGRVSLSVFNILGQQVVSLIDGYRPAGIHQVEFDGADLPSGIYFYRLQYDGGSTTRKMTLVK